MVKFPQDESGGQRKLSRPWHGPYRITSLDNPQLKQTATEGRHDSE